MIEYIRSLLDSADARVVAVVSAMGRAGSPYATDTLISLLSPEAHSQEARETDLIMACGEIIATAVLANALRRAGISAAGRTGWEAGIVTDAAHTNAKILHVEPSLILKDLETHQVVVIAGFQGVTTHGEISCLGRGGSDTSAVAIAAALGLDEIHIVKDVSGIFTADPTVVPRARTVSSLSAEDVRQMGWQGARVVHPRAAELAMRHHIRIRVGGMDAEDLATIVVPRVPLEAIGTITAVSSGPVIAQIRYHAPDSSQQHITNLFMRVAQLGVSMDMFTVNDGACMFTVPESNSQPLLDALASEFPGLAATGGCCKVSIIGAGMHGVPGVMARFTDALTNADIRILQTVDSHATISALIRAEDVGRAVCALHAVFLER